MKTIRFLLGKIIITEIMMLIIYFSINLFKVHINIIDIILNIGLKYLTPIASFCLIPYIILSLFNSKVIDTIIGVVVGGLILYYLFHYILI